MTHFPVYPRRSARPPPGDAPRSSTPSPVNVGFVHVGIAPELHLFDKAKQKWPGLYDRVAVTSIVSRAGGVKILNAPLDKTRCGGARPYKPTSSSKRRSVAEIALRGTTIPGAARQDRHAAHEGYIRPEPGEVTLFIKPTLRDDYALHQACAGHRVLAGRGQCAVAARAHARLPRRASTKLAAVDKRIADLRQVRTTLRRLVSQCDAGGARKCPIIASLSGVGALTESDMSG